MFASRVLLIEDDASIRAAVRAAIEADGGVVFEAATGAAGSAILIGERPDLIVLDIGLPDVDGLALCRTLRGHTSAPIVVLSARDRDADKAALLDAGADDYVTKPFSPVELRARVRAQLRRARMEAHRAGTTRVTSHGLVIDLATRTVQRDGHPLHLTPTEWELLRALAEDAGRTVTHRQLFARVWGRPYGDAQQYLRVYVAHLRRKVEVDPLRPVVIVTEPGVGYRLDPIDDDPHTEAPHASA